MDWFTTHAIEQGWATCAITELGVIRVCAQLPGGAWLPDTTAGALLVLTASSPGYVWWPDVTSPVLLQEVRSASTGKQVTDRYLIGVARRNGGRVATFDRALSSWRRRHLPAAGAPVASPMERSTAIISASPHL